MPVKIIQQGAEAIVSLEKNKIHKKRIRKSYRISEIDEKLRKQRTKKEAKLLEKLQEKISVPKIIKLNEDKQEIIMQYIKGKKLSEHLDNLKNKEKIMEEVGKQISALHKNIIHGDLTTSNMILDEKENKVFFIDFGLSFHSTRIEDRACDLHLLRQALEAKHFLHYKKLFKAVLSGYKSKEKNKILKQLEKVEKRGRYK